MGSKQALDFIQDIIFRFGVPTSIIIDNDAQFIREKSLDFGDDNNIRVDWVVVSHPRTNEQVEHTNGMILQGLKVRILTQEGEDVHAWLSTTIIRSAGYEHALRWYHAQWVHPQTFQVGNLVL
jgi:hypothetical protein